MIRKFEEKKLVIASHNQGKIREINALLEPFDVEVVGGAEANVPEPEETEDSFIGNAELKSRAFVEATGHACLSDDSGLVVPALDGAPGIYSARWAGEPRDFNAAMEKVRERLVESTGTDEGHEAYFACALSLCWPDGVVFNVEGRVEGHLEFPMRGEKGFGYDPIFVAKGYDITFAEMDPAEKHRISHRADAFNQLIKQVFQPE